GDQIKVQVVRAEWDHTAFLNEKPDNAGQPHWHVDRHLELETATPPAPAVGGELQEPSRGLNDVATPLQEKNRTQSVKRRLNVHKMHLAMGGWRNYNLPEGAPGGVETQAKSQ